MKTTFPDIYRDQFKHVNKYWLHFENQIKDKHAAGENGLFEWNPQMYVLFKHFHRPPKECPLAFTRLFCSLCVLFQVFSWLWDYQLFPRAEQSESSDCLIVPYK